MKSDHHTGQMLDPGTMVDHFKVVRLIGLGGMGEIYLARDTRLGRKVAIKVLSTHRFASRKAVDLFVREARITAKFNHPHIVTIYAVGEHQGSPYLALEYLEGQTLRERLDRESIGITESLRIGLAIAQALAEARRNRVLHRDLTPGNVLMCRDGRLRVLDFGIALDFGITTVEAVEDVVSTRPSLGRLDPVAQGQSPTSPIEEPTLDSKRGVLGTAPYLAPERWMEQEGTEATDIWALGVILHELAAGRRPYPASCLASTAALRARICSEEKFPSVETSRQVPPGLSDLIGRCLERDPEERPVADEVAEGLRDILSSMPKRSVGELGPFRGLLPFGEQHADFFFGRDAEVAVFLERLREVPLLSVVGPSGVGKSSFVQAGVLPRLREQGSWVVLKLRPGNRPFKTLASLLLSERCLLEDQTVELRRRSGTGETSNGSPSRSAGRMTERDRESSSLPQKLLDLPSLLNLALQEIAERERSSVLLFVDQLEELFTLVDDELVRKRWAQAIFAAADDPYGKVRVVFAIREDFLGRLAELIEASEPLSQVKVLGSPGSEVLKEILIKPVQVCGYRYDDQDVVQEIVSAVGTEPVCLPLLQLTARALWDHRDKARRLLTRSAYESMGRVAGALAEGADGALRGMSAFQVQLARQLLLRLVTAEGTRRILPRSRVLEGLAVEAKEVLDRLIRARLISVRAAWKEEADEAALELVHESLVQAWDRLARWVEESREDLAFLVETGEAADLWERRGRPDEEVWRDDALAEAQRRAARCQDVPEQVRRFLAAGERQQRRRVGIRRAFLASGVVLLSLIAVAALAVSWIVRQKEQEAQRQKRVAQNERREAIGQRTMVQREGARSAFMRGRLIEARAKLRSVLEAQDSPLARALWWRLTRSQLHWSKQLGGVIYDVAFSPGEDQVAVACMDRAIYLFDVLTAGVRILRGHTDQVFSVAYSPDGRRLVSGAWGGEIRIWDLRSGRSRSITGDANGISSVTVSPDGRYLASAGFDSTVRLWDFPSGKPRMVLHGHKARVTDVGFSPDGRLLASASYDKTVRLWQVSSGKVSKVLRGHGAVIRSVSIGPRGRLLASAGYDKKILLWRLPSGERLTTLRGHDAAVRSISIGPRGRLLASAGYDKEIRLQRLPSGEMHRVLYGIKGTANSLSMSPSGRFLVAGGTDNTVWLWHLSSAQPELLRGGHRAQVVGLDFSPDGRLLASASYDKTIRLWRLPSGEPHKVLRGHKAVIRSVSIGPRGRLLASASYDKTIRLWHLPSGKHHKVLRGHKGIVFDVRISPDGQWLASGSGDRTIRLWHLPSGAVRGTLRGHKGSILGLSISPDGRLLASTGWDKTVRLWGIRPAGQRRQHVVLRGHQAETRGIDFDPFGRFLASGSTDGTVRLWQLGSRKSRVLARSLGRIYRLQFDPKGQRVGAACSNGTAMIWDLTGKRSLVLRGHRAEVNSIRFSRDGRFVATGGDDGTVRLWDASSGKPIWRAALLRANPIELCTHRGWIHLDGSPVSNSGAQWRRVVRQTARVAAESEDGTLLCLWTHTGNLEIWDLKEDRRLSRTRLRNLTRILAQPYGCLTLARGVVRLHDRSGAHRILVKQVSAINHNHNEILVAAAGQVRVLGPLGSARTHYPTDVGVTALGRVGDRIVLGFQDGNLELLPTPQHTKKSQFMFENIPPSPVVRILPGPMGTLIAGYANGLVGLWHLGTGVQLEHVWLHGPAIHLMLKGSRLYMASELGQHRIWNLRVFFRPYCELMQLIWAQVPVVWRKGVPVRRAPPRGHRCSVGPGHRP